MKYDFKDYLVNVIIINKNNRNVYFRVDDESNLVVTCPKYMNNTDIKNLIKSNETSLKKMINKSLKKQANADKFKYLGKYYEIIFVQNL